MEKEIQDDAERDLCCQTCNTQYAIKEDLEEHSWSIDHHVNLCETRRKWVVHECKLCNVQNSDSKGFMQHLHGKKHQKRLVTYEAFKKGQKAREKLDEARNESKAIADKEKRKDRPTRPEKRELRKLKEAEGKITKEAKSAEHKLKNVAKDSQVEKKEKSSSNKYEKKKKKSKEKKQLLYVDVDPTLVSCNYNKTGDETNVEQIAPTTKDWREPVKLIPSKAIPNDVTVKDIEYDSYSEICHQDGINRSAMKTLMNSSNSGNSGSDEIEDLSSQREDTSKEKEIESPWQQQYDQFPIAPLPYDFSRMKKDRYSTVASKQQDDRSVSDREFTSPETSSIRRVRSVSLHLDDKGKKEVSTPLPKKDNLNISEKAMQIIDNILKKKESTSLMSGSAERASSIPDNITNSLQPSINPKGSRDTKGEKTENIIQAAKALCEVVSKNCQSFQQAQEEADQREKQEYRSNLNKNSEHATDRVKSRLNYRGRYQYNRPQMCSRNFQNDDSRPYWRAQHWRGSYHKHDREPHYSDHPFKYQPQHLYHFKQRSPSQPCSGGPMGGLRPWYSATSNLQKTPPARPESAESEQLQTGLGPLELSRHAVPKSVKDALSKQQLQRNSHSSKLMDKDSLLKLVNAPRSRKEQVQVAKIIQKHVKQHRKEAPRPHLSSRESLHEEEDLSSVNIEELPDHVRDQIAQLLHSERVSSEAEVNKDMMPILLSSHDEGEDEEDDLDLIMCEDSTPNECVINIKPHDQSHSHQDFISLLSPDEEESFMQVQPESRSASKSGAVALSAVIIEDSDEEDILNSSRGTSVKRRKKISNSTDVSESDSSTKLAKRAKTEKKSSGMRSPTISSTTDVLEISLLDSCVKENDALSSMPAGVSESSAQTVDSTFGAGGEVLTDEIMEGENTDPTSYIAQAESAVTAFLSSSTVTYGKNKIPSPRGTIIDNPLTEICTTAVNEEPALTMQSTRSTFFECSEIQHKQFTIASSAVCNPESPNTSTSHPTSPLRAQNLSSRTLDKRISLAPVTRVATSTPEAAQVTVTDTKQSAARSPVASVPVAAQADCMDQMLAVTLREEEIRGKLSEVNKAVDKLQCLLNKTQEQLMRRLKQKEKLLKEETLLRTQRISMLKGAVAQRTGTPVSQCIAITENQENVSNIQAFDSSTLLGTSEWESLCDTPRDIIFDPGNICHLKSSSSVVIEHLNSASSAIAISATDSVTCETVMTHLSRGRPGNDLDVTCEPNTKLRLDHANATKSHSSDNECLTSPRDVGFTYVGSFQVNQDKNAELLQKLAKNLADKHKTSYTILTEEELAGSGSEYVLKSRTQSQCTEENMTDIESNMNRPATEHTGKPWAADDRQQCDAKTLELKSVKSENEFKKLSEMTAEEQNTPSTSYVTLVPLETASTMEHDYTKSAPSKKKVKLKRRKKQSKIKTTSDSSCEEERCDKIQEKQRRTRSSNISPTGNALKVLLHADSSTELESEQFYSYKANQGCK